MINFLSQTMRGGSNSKNYQKQRKYSKYLYKEKRKIRQVSTAMVLLL